MLKMPSLSICETEHSAMHILQYIYDISINRSDWRQNKIVIKINIIKYFTEPFIGYKCKLAIWYMTMLTIFLGSPL